MDAWIIWLIAACILVLLEVLSQAVWSLCFAIGCLAAMIVSFMTNSVVVQAFTAPIIALMAWVLLAPIVRKWELNRNKQSRTGMEALLGRRAVVTEEVRPGELGRARIDGDNWQVDAPGIAAAIPRGTEVVVTAYNSIILTVETLEK